MFRFGEFVDFDLHTKFDMNTQGDSSWVAHSMLELSIKNGSDFDTFLKQRYRYPD